MTALFLVISVLAGLGCLEALRVQNETLAFFFASICFFFALLTRDAYRRRR